MLTVDSKFLRLIVHLRNEFGSQWRDKLPPQPETTAWFPLITPDGLINQLPQPTTSNMSVASGITTEPVSEATEAAPAVTTVQANDTAIQKFEEMKNKGNQLVGKVGDVSVIQNGAILFACFVGEVL